jgi:hypothetical protein
MSRFLREVSLHVSGTGWRAYDHFIGQPIFYSGFSENMIAAVLSNPILRSRITELAQKRISVEEKEGLLNKNDPMYLSKRSRRQTQLEQSLQELSEKLADDMICKLESKLFIRGAYYLASQLLTRAYHQGKELREDFCYLRVKAKVRSLKAFMSQVKRSSVYEKLPKRQRKTSKASSSCLVIDLM